MLLRGVEPIVKTTGHGKVTDTLAVATFRSQWYGFQDRLFAVSYPAAIVF